jgi:hypothetical protein
MAGSWDVGPGSKGGTWDSTASAVPQASLADESLRSGPGGSGIPVSQAPIVWLVAGLTAASLGLVIPLISRRPGLALIGWSLGGLVAVGLLGVFLWRDLERRSRGVAADSHAADWLRRLLVVAAVVSVALNAWVIADAIARGNW